MALILDKKQGSSVMFLFSDHLERRILGMSGLCSSQITFLSLITPIMMNKISILQQLQSARKVVSQSKLASRSNTTVSLRNFHPVRKMFHHKFKELAKQLLPLLIHKMPNIKKKSKLKLN